MSLQYRYVFHIFPWFPKLSKSKIIKWIFSNVTVWSHYVRVNSFLQNHRYLHIPVSIMKFQHIYRFLYIFVVGMGLYTRLNWVISLRETCSLFTNYILHIIIQIIWPQIMYYLAIYILYFFNNCFIVLMHRSLECILGNENVLTSWIKVTGSVYTIQVWLKLQIHFRGLSWSCIKWICILVVPTSFDWKSFTLCMEQESKYFAVYEKCSLF